MLQQDEPQDYVIATGESYSIRNLVETAFSYVGLNWKDYVIVDENLYRPSEIHELRGDFNKARKQLGWEPKVSFRELIQMMVDADMRAIRSPKIRPSPA